MYTEMKLVWLILSVAFLGSLVVSLEDVAENFLSNRIDAVEGEFPGAVYLKLSHTDRDCGAAIVNNLHVVTVASCVTVLQENRTEIVNPNWIRVIAGDLNITEPTINRVERLVSHVFIHPNYNRFSFENNIAVLRVSQQFAFPHNAIEPVTLNSRIVPNDHSCVFAGWRSGNELLQKVAVSILDRDYCGTNIHLRGRIFESTMCISFPYIVQLNCIGDQGSGLYCNNKLSGILSNIYCGNDMQNVFIQLRYYNDWIVQQFNRSDNSSQTW